MRTQRLRSAAVAILLAATPAVVLLGTTSPAGADPNVTVDAVARPMWQTNNAVWALATDAASPAPLNRNRVYAAGEFTQVRPPGVAVGGPGSVTRNRLAAFDRTTGALVANVNVNVAGRVLALAISPDGQTLYLGGEFTRINGQPRGKAAAIDLTTPNGSLVSWDPGFAGGAVRAISATDTGVYFGGSFTGAGPAQPRTHTAAFAPRGALLPWAPQPDGPVNAILAQPNENRIFLGGAFDNVGGNRIRALATVDAADGNFQPTLPNGLIPSIAGYPAQSVVKSIVTDGEWVFVGAEGQGAGFFDGTLSVNPSTGAMRWRTVCQGATQAITVMRGTLYVGNHAHDCTEADGFGQLPNVYSPRSWHHLMAEDAATGALRTWWPTTNAGPHNNVAPYKLELGPRAMANDGSTLFVGGHFSTVNGAAQQGLTRFVSGGDTSRPTTPQRLTASRPAPGTVVVRWQGGSDMNDPALTYRLYRDNVLVHTSEPVSGRWYNTPTLVYRDTTAGNVQRRYAVEAVDASGNVSPRTPLLTVAATATPGYGSTVLADGATQVWRLDEPAGPTVSPASGRGTTGTLHGDVTADQPGPFGPTSRAMALNSGFITTDGAASTPSNVQSMEIWFRTDTKTGGRIVGWGNNQHGPSTTGDRHVYMNRTGQLNFGALNGTTRSAAWAAQSYNDNTWHHLVATMGSGGLRLYVDGALVATDPTTTGATYAGWFRVGNDTFTGWPRVLNLTSASYSSATSAFEGTVANVAVYPTQLTAAQIQRHYQRGE